MVIYVQFTFKFSKNGNMLQPKPVLTSTQIEPTVSNGSNYHESPLLPMLYTIFDVAIIGKKQFFREHAV